MSMATSMVAPAGGWPTKSDAAAALVNQRLERATVLGRELADDMHDPVRFAAALADAFRELADPEYQEGQHFVAPGLGPTHGVRTPLQVAIRKGFEKGSPASISELLLIADRLLREQERESRWFAISTLQRTLPREPERSWQLLRRAATDADDWITVDNLAHPFGKGILAEPYRWAELEQLTVSPSRWERRLVGSTIATLPFVNRTAGRAPEVAEHGLALLATLIGDAEPDVQKALSWAYRSMLVVDAEATAAALERQARIAAREGDGHRAWVIRDVLPKLDPATSGALREQLGGIRRRPNAPATSEASALATRFEAMGLGRRMPDPPLT